MLSRSWPLATAYGTQLLLEAVEARCNGRRPRFAGGPIRLVDFLLSAHISGLAVAMLLYFNDRLWVVAFAAAVAIASKTLFRAPFGAGTRHVFNPSNFGIVATLLLFPGSVGLVQPWQFTEELPGQLDWGLFALICQSRLVPQRPVHEAPAADRRLAGRLHPPGGVAELLFRYFAAGEPGADDGPGVRAVHLLHGPRPGHDAGTPRAQVAFGAGVAAVYGLLMAFHVVFALFLSLVLVCGARGLWLFIAAREAGRDTPP